MLAWGMRLVRSRMAGGVRRSAGPSKVAGGDAARLVTYLGSLVALALVLVRCAIQHALQRGEATAPSLWADRYHVDPAPGRGRGRRFLSHPCKCGR